MCPTKPKIFTLQPYVDKVCPPLVEKEPGLGAGGGGEMGILGSGQRRPLCGRDFELRPNDGEKKKKKKHQAKESRQNKQ